MGHVTGVGGKSWEQNYGDNLHVGEQYFVEEYETWEEHNGNGGSTYSSPSKNFRVYALATQKLLSSCARPAAFRRGKIRNCRHKERYFLCSESNIERCHGCFKKFKTIASLKEVA
jgi:hypothetical protein